MKTHRPLGTLTLAAWLCAASCPAAEPLAPLLSCRALTDPGARLACFDRESARLAAPAAASTAAAPANPPATASSPSIAAPAQSAATPPASSPRPTPAAPPPVADPKQTFGLPEAAIAEKEEAAGMRPKQLAKIDAHISSVSLSGVGLATFALDNGQVWRQITPDGDLLAKPGDLATVSRGLFHSYWLQLKSGRGCKVTRIL